MSPGNSEQPPLPGDRQRRSLLNFAVGLAGGLSALIGSTVLVGYYTQNARLLQVIPTLAPMAHNTALGFLLGGLGTLAISLGKPSLALPGGVYAAVVGLMTLGEDIFGKDFGIDRLLTKYYVPTQGLYPARMSLPSAVCWLLVGLILLAMNLLRRPRLRSPIMGILSSAVLAIGGVALFGFLAHLETAYGWGDFKPMAILTSICFVILGVALMAVAWREGRTAAVRTRNWQPIMLGVTLLFVTLLLWGALIRIQSPGARQTLALAGESTTVLTVGILTALLFTLASYLAPSARGVRGSQPVILRLLLLGGVLPVVGRVAARLLFFSQAWEQIPLHSLIAGLGSLVALSLGGLILLLLREGHGPGHRIWIACGLIWMGMLEGFHAGVPSGNVFIWLHAAGALLGGMLFALVWLPDQVSRARPVRVLPIVLLVVATAMGVVALLLPGMLPTMTDAGGLSLLTKVGNAIAGVFFIVAAVGLIVRYRSTQDDDDLLFATLSLLFGSGGVLYQTSLTWSSDWWFWHLLELTAYVVAISFILRSFVRAQREIRGLNVSLDRHVRELEQDITERRQVEQALRESQASLQLQIERMPIACIVWSPEFRVTEWNPAAEQTFGFAREEAMGKHPYDLIVPKSAQAQVDAIWGRLLEGDSTAHSENENFTKDGRTILCYWTNTPLKSADGRIVGVLSMAQDITERKEDEERIRRQSAILDAINRVFQDAMTCETDADVAQTCLEMAERLTGSQFGFVYEINADGRADALAMSSPDWNSGNAMPNFVPAPVKNLEIRSYWGRVLRTGESQVVNDPATDPDRSGVPPGHPPIECFLGVPLRAAGKAFGLIGLANRPGGYTSADREAVEALGLAFVEALNRKRSEMLVKRLNLELERRVADLNTANKELESFAYSVAHDLRAPLRGISGFNQAMLEDYGDRLDAQARSFIERSRAATRRMGRLIDDLLELSSITHHSIEYRSVNLSELARAAATELQRSSPERRVEFAIPDGIRAEADPQLLRQVLTNLIGNAWKFTSRRPDARIEFGTCSQDGETVFFVRDNGAGFDMTYVKQLFQPFHRLHSEEEYAGTGIGLAIVQRIIRRHHGRVWAESVLGQGATFYFTLSTGDTIPPRVPIETRRTNVKDRPQENSLS